MDVWATRAALAADRFSTRFEVRSHGWGDGRVGVGFWAKTWHWGDLINETCFHEHVLIADHTSAECVAETFAKAVASVAEVVRRAQAEFPDRVPCQILGRTEDGRLLIAFAEHSDEMARQHRAKTGYDRSAFPPNLPGNLPVPEGGVGYLSAISALAVRGQGDGDLLFDWCDCLTPYAEPRYARDPRPEVWQYEASPRIRSFRGARVSAVGQHNLTVNRVRPDGAAAAETAEGMIADVAARFAASAPDFPEGYERHVVKPLPSYPDI